MRHKHETNLIYSVLIPDINIVNDPKRLKSKYDLVLQSRGILVILLIKSQIINPFIIFRSF
jgi:hypothetical protein